MLPLTDRLEFKVVAVAVTLKSVVMLVTFVPANSFSFSTHSLPFQRKVVLVCVPAFKASLSLQTVEVPVVVSICPLVPALPELSTRAALRVIVLLAVKVPLAVVFAATTKSLVKVVLPVTLKVESKVVSVPVTVKSPVIVVVPLTARLEFKVVAVAVTLKSVVMVVTFVPANSFSFSTHSLPFQRKVVLVVVPAPRAKLSLPNRGSTRSG